MTNDGLNNKCSSRAVRTKRLRVLSVPQTPRNPAPRQRIKKRGHISWETRLYRYHLRSDNDIHLKANQDVKINISHQQIQKINIFAYNFDLINNNRSPPSEGVRSSLLDVLEWFFDVSP